jgi:hypothetical protein
MEYQEVPQVKVLQYGNVCCGVDGCWRQLCAILYSNFELLCHSGV